MYNANLDMSTWTFAKTFANKKFSFAISEKNFRRDCSLHTQRLTQRKPLSRTFCSTLIYIYIYTTHISNHFNTFLINPFAIRELSAFIQPKLVVNPVHRCQIITHGCFGDFRHEWQWLGFWVGELKRCRKIFPHCINMLVSRRTVTTSHLQILCFQQWFWRGDHTFWDTSTVRKQPVDLTPSQPSAFLHKCIVKLKLMMYTVYLYFCVTAAQGPSRTSTSSSVFRRLISVDLCRRPQANQQRTERQNVM